MYEFPLRADSSFEEQSSRSSALGTEIAHSIPLERVNGVQKWKETMKENARIGAKLLTHIRSPTRQVIPALVSMPKGGLFARPNLPASLRRDPP